MANHRTGVTIQSFINHRFTRRRALIQSAAGLAAGTVVAGLARDVSAQDATPEATGNVSSLIDIGGRSIYVEAHGAGGPTVVLLCGYRTSARYWTDDLHHPEAPRKMVMAGVADFTRVYTYDRPGTFASIGDDLLPSRSDPIAQPRTAPEVVVELQALLHAAAVAGPYVFAAHSLGGLFARLYASTYPDEVIGLVLIDAVGEGLEDLLGPDLFPALVRLNQVGGSDTVQPLPGYNGDVETLGFGANNQTMRVAAAASPLRSMPLAVLEHGVPFTLPTDVDGLTSDVLEAGMRAANRDLASLVPNGRLFTAADSGHDIHQDQPELVIEAIRQVVEGVRNPDTWYSLTPLSSH